MKIPALVFFASCKLLTAQLLTVNNLQHLATSPIQHLDKKLAEHFEMKRNPDMEDKNNRVYSTDDQHHKDFKVLTVFTEAKNCLALSIVTHDHADVHSFHTDLLKEGFALSKHKDHEGNILKKFIRNNFVVIIKSLDNKTPPHQILWMCR